jgi:hypothetical protein
MQDAYSTARHWGRTIDAGAQIASKLYGAIQPALRDYAPTAEKVISSNVRAVKGEYDSIRDRVVGENERAGNAIASVKSNLPNLGL